MYEFNDESIVEWCLDEITSIDDEEMQKIKDFCQIGEARYMKFYDFVEALEDIREHQITDGADLYSTMLFLTMIKGDIDD